MVTENTAGLPESRMPVGNQHLFERICRRLAHLCGEGNPGALVDRLEQIVERYGDLRHSDGTGARRGGALWDQQDAFLITYGDMVSRGDESPLQTLLGFVERHLGDAVSGIHVLPFFPYSSDDGFSVMDYRQVDAALGGWEQIQSLGERYRLMVDLVINHVSARGAWFRSYSKGVAPERYYFLEIEPGTDLSEVTRPRTSPLLRPVQTPYGRRLVWATFSHDQIDLDFSNPDVLFEFLDILLFYVHHGARIIRLDAIAYLWKTIGTNCIHLDETHMVVKLLRDLLELLAPGSILLTETNVPHEENVSYFGEGGEAHMVYQFSLPPLLLHALETGESRYLTDWVASLEPPPDGCTFFNFTASHDGIGLRPLEGLLPVDERNALVERMKQKGGRICRRENPDGLETPYELNITYFDALSSPGRKDSDEGIRRFLCSQAIMLSLQGIPGIYFNSLIGAPNWLAGIEETGRARTINRRKWGLAELEYLLQDATRPASRVFPEYIHLLTIRRAHPAFHPSAPQQALEIPRGLFGIKRTAPDGSEELWVLANLTGEPIGVQPESVDRRFKQRWWKELIQGWSRAGEEIGQLELAPYQVMWLSPSAANRVRG